MEIGITILNSIKERFRKDIVLGCKIEVLNVKYFKTGREAYIEEKSLHKQYRDFKYKGDNILISGNSELFIQHCHNF